MYTEFFQSRFEQMARSRAMRPSVSRKRSVSRLLAIAFISIAGAVPVFSAVFDVNSNADPGDGTCNVANCTIREAVNAANAAGGTDTITFHIGTGPQTIILNGGLSVQNSPAILDATTQPGYAGVPIIELNGNGTGGDGLTIFAGGSTVRGFIINRFGGNGIGIFNTGGDVISGNYIGTDATGSIARPNGQNGIFDSSPSNTVGGLTAANRNVISGNAQNGLVIQNGSSTNNVVQGNYIGVNAAGTAALGNGENGIRIDGPAEAIGGGSSGAGNVISGNTLAGIVIVNGGSTNNRIQGNYIGTDFTGSVAIPNQNGVIIGDTTSPLPHGVPNAVIGTNGDGSLDATEGNLISGNTNHGLVLTLGGTTTNRVAGNLIGTNAAGTGSIPNGGNGVFVVLGADNNTIGSNNDGLSDDLEENTIANNGGNGIVLADSGTGNRIFRNSIYSNTGLGIDLGDDGVTPNDPGDGDTGPNNRQNFPVITGAFTGSTIINFALNSTAGTQFRVEFFGSVTPDASGHGEGATPLGSVVITTNGSGNFTGSFTSPVTTPAGNFVTATATNTTTGDVSEFSQNVVVTPPTAAHVTVGGRVLTSDGRSVAGARVVISGKDGAARATTTNAFGFYRFDDIEAGQGYVIEAKHKRYAFAAQLVVVNDLISDLDIIADPPGKGFDIDIR